MAFRTQKKCQFIARVLPRETAVKPEALRQGGSPFQGPGLEEGELLVTEPGAAPQLEALGKERLEVRILDRQCDGRRLAAEIALVGTLVVGLIGLQRAPDESPPTFEVDDVALGLEKQESDRLLVEDDGSRRCHAVGHAGHQDGRRIALYGEAMQRALEVLVFVEADVSDVDLEGRSGGLLVLALSLRQGRGRQGDDHRPVDDALLTRVARQAGDDLLGLLRIQRPKVRRDGIERQVRQMALPTVCEAGDRRETQLLVRCAEHRETAFLRVVLLQRDARNVDELHRQARRAGQDWRVVFVAEGVLVPLDFELVLVRTRPRPRTLMIAGHFLEQLVPLRLAEEMIGEAEGAVL